jgi:pimeloyl-ACP methyl ester carboxylesterase
VSRPPSPAQLSEEVVLVSGLWVPAAAMAVLGSRLRRHGFAPRTFSYYGREPFAANIERFADFARRLRAPAAHFVGQSLGGVLVFDMLSAHRDVPAGRVVLLGAPVRGSLAGRRLARYAVGRWMLGGSALRWQERDAAWRRSEPLGVIAGTRPLGLGRVLGRLPGEHDGVVRVEETAVAGAEGVRVPEGHSPLPFSRRVASLVQRFLREGRFA